MRLARSLSLTLLLSLAGLAAHATTLMIDRDLPPDATVVGTSFAADTATHGAWVSSTSSSPPPKRTWSVPSAWRFPV
jgi:hypothetical protein